eukprot:10626371-Alexandrium_andersonii.AAC.1
MAPSSEMPETQLLRSLEDFGQSFAEGANAAPDAIPEPLPSELLPAAPANRGGECEQGAAVGNEAEQDKEGEGDEAELEESTEAPAPMVRSAQYKPKAVA